jgi:hypothetical protein
VEDLKPKPVSSRDASSSRPRAIPLPSNFYGDPIADLDALAAKYGSDPKETPKE